jgi:hypothetical protein
MRHVWRQLRSQINDVLGLKQNNLSDLTRKPKNLRKIQAFCFHEVSQKFLVAKIRHIFAIRTFMFKEICTSWPFFKYKFLEHFCGEFR